MIILFEILFVTITISASTSILLGRDRRWTLIFLGVQYVGVFWFVYSTWTFNLAVIKLIAGLIVCIILAFNSETQDRFSIQETSWPQGRIFRIIAASLIIFSTLAVSTTASSWMGVANTTGIWIGLFLLGMGILQLGITTQHDRVIIALLTLISGFEIIYSFVETSSLVAALFVTINIGFAVTAVYLNLMDQRVGSE